jgi:type IX secretion system PorP/SprF family membrane protein
VKVKSLFYWFPFLLGTAALGQDFQFGQFYAVPLYNNPAFVGSNLNSRFVSAYRNQWAGLQGWKGWFSSFDWHIKKASSGIGLFFSGNQLDRIGYGHTSGMFQYAYRARIRKEVRASLGLGVGFGQVRWSRSKGVFGDQLEIDPIRPSSLDPLAFQSLRAGYLDLQVGALVYSRTWWVALSALHPQTPVFEMLGSNQVDPRITLSAGYRFEMEKETDYKNQITPRSITPAILLRSQGTASQLDAGVYVHYVPFVFGIWYRGIPSPVPKADRLNQDALTLLAGIKQNNLSIGYSYDINLSGLVGVLGGSHELTLTYEFKTKYLNLKGSRPQRGLPCPSF